MEGIKQVDIVDFIPFGYEHPITRKELCTMLDMIDRDVRRLIEKARKQYVIVNLSDGRGYFRPTIGERRDVRAVVNYVRQEESRKRSIEEKLQTAYTFLIEAVANE